MLPSVYRLHSNRSFDVIYKRGKSVAGEGMVVLYLASKLDTPKVGFVVSKKVGKAVVRNKVKRRLREAFYSMMPEVAHHYSYIVLARTGAVEKTYGQLREELASLLSKADKLRKA